MTHESLLTRDWESVVARLGGAEALDKSARATKAFLRPREIRSAVDLLRMVLAYCLGDGGLRLTAAWATAIGLVDISNVALLKRLRNCGDWLAVLVGQVLVANAPEAAKRRMIRIVDATCVPKAGAGEKQRNALWRVHSAFDLPHERFGHFELTDERGAHRRTRGLSPPGRRLTRPGSWRLLRQLIATLLSAVIPQPTFACLRTRMAAMRRHLHEPTRRRKYQCMIRLC